MAFSGASASFLKKAVFSDAILGSINLNILGLWLYLCYTRFTLLSYIYALVYAWYICGMLIQKNALEMKTENPDHSYPIANKLGSPANDDKRADRFFVKSVISYELF